MKRRLGKTLFLVAIVGIPTAAGCNGILGNKEAQLFDVDASVPIDGSDSGVVVIPDATPTPDDGGNPPDVVQPIPDAATPGCATGKKSCFGDCVTSTDPIYGCTVDGCTACSVPRATANCAGGKCAVAACNPGYADCNQDPKDGCETDLSEATHCGSCNAVCGASAPLCAPNGGGFACTSGCSGQAPTLCGTQCVDLTNSRAHCGQCNNTCAAVGNAQVTCSGSACKFSCDNGFHGCGNACASNTDPTTCGTSCTPCAVPSFGIATCSLQGQCGFTCMPGFHECGAQCVSDTSVASCGASCTPCAPPAFATATCGGSPLACGFTCDGAHHACGATCAANDDVATCGATCGTPCMAGPNATPGCDGTKCTSTCNGSFKDCDPAAPGCESDSQTDPLNCGNCGVSCNGQACVGGVCNVPPPPDAGTD